MLCAQCKHKDYDPHPYVRLLWEIHELQLAGWTFGREELDLPKWYDLAYLKTRVGRCPIM